MAANTLLEMSRSLKNYVGQLPITLAEQFIRDRYRRILERRNWSALRREADFILNAENSTGTVAYTRGDSFVDGTGTSFIGTDTNRQFKIGTGSPVYTVVEVDALNQRLTLDRAIGVATATAASFRIFDGYVTVPEDFLQFVAVTDPLMGWRLRHWVTAEELARMDPQRTFFGTPYVLADRMYNVATAGSDQPRPQYEAWPYTASDRVLHYTYIIRGTDLINNDDIPIWPLRSDVIVKGALADLAKWPGTQSEPNPYFSRPDMWKSYEAEYEDLMIELERRDEDVYMTQLQASPSSTYPLAPLFSTDWQYNHAV
jgi:hypothetical protein